MAQKDEVHRSESTYWGLEDYVGWHQQGRLR
jgi:hypothetical protein